MTLRLSEEEFKKMFGEVPGKRKSKYNSRKTYVDGICFDSQAEADYYCQLKLLLRAGEITGFCLQPRFIITAGDENTKATEYRADFIVFYPNETYRIIDVKGVETQTFKLKIKCFLEKIPKLKVFLEKE